MGSSSSPSPVTTPTSPTSTTSAEEFIPPPVTTKKYTLNNGIEMPAVGVGTFRVRHPGDIYKAVDYSLRFGYRLFDTAEVYDNDVFLGRAFRELLPKYKLQRKDVFITTKMAPKHHGSSEKIEKAFNETLKNLLLDYVDLYLIHWPGSTKILSEDTRNAELREKTWETLVKLQNEGRVKSIGVSNYTQRHLQELLDNDYGVKPVVNQVEWHPYYYDLDMLQFCKDNNVVLQAYSSLGGTSIRDWSLMQDPVVVRISERLNKSPSQVLLAWAVQQDVAVIPKSVNYLRIMNNINLEFTLTEDDMIDLYGLGTKRIKYAWDPSFVY